MDDRDERLADYKNKGKDDATQRSKRRDGTVELRKNKRIQSISKRRNIDDDDSDSGGGAAAAYALDAAGQLALQQQIHGIVAGMQTDGNPQVQQQAAVACRILLSTTSTQTFHLVIAAGAVSHLGTLLTLDAFPGIQQEAAWALSLLASGNTAQTAEVARLLPVLVRLLDSPNNSVQEHVLLTLGNIAGDGAAMRDAVLAQGSMAKVLALIQSTFKLSLSRRATWTLSNLCRFFKSNPPPAHDAEAALPVLKYIVENKQDTDTLSDACWAINYLTMGPSERLQAVLKAGLGRPVVEMLKIPELSVVLPALQITVNAVGGTDAQTDHMLSLGTLPLLRGFLSHADSNIVREACWAISNVAAGTPVQRRALMDQNIMPSVVNVAESGEHQDIGGLKGLIQNMNMVEERGPLTVFLKGVHDALRVGDNHDRSYDDEIEEMSHGIGRIEQMAEYHDNGVVLEARKILDEYFPEVSDDED